MLNQIITVLNRTTYMERLLNDAILVCGFYFSTDSQPAGMDNSDTSDVDFKAISSGDSEQESDEEEEEEIKDSGSNVDEEFDKAEVFVWDDKNKRYKKPRLWTTDDPKVVKLGHVGERGSPAYEEAERWYPVALLFIFTNDSYYTLL